jgi:hypothetical protein
MGLGQLVFLLYASSSSSSLFQIRSFFSGGGSLMICKGLHGLLGAFRAVAGGDIQVGPIVDKLFNRNPIALAGFRPTVVSDFFTYAAHRQYGLIKRYLSR